MSFRWLCVGVITAIVAGCAADNESSSIASENLETAPAAADAAALPNGPVASTMASSLTAIGLDINALPPTLDALDPDTKHKVMRTFTTALGVQCSGCHEGHDFAKPTVNKKIAARMWTEFVVGLKLKDGSGPMYCDSCHQGKAEFLPRTPHGVLRGWMQTNFVDKLQRTDGATHECATCHGNPFQGDIFKNVWHAED